jgi:hypothetical protein
VTGDCVVSVGTGPPRGKADGDGDSVGGAGGCVKEALRDDVTADGEGLGTGSVGAGAAGDTGRAGADDCREDERGRCGTCGERGEEDGTKGSGTNNGGGLGSGRPSFGIGRPGGAAAISSTVPAPLRGGAGEAPSVTQPIRATSNACPTSSATAMRTVRRTVHVTGTGGSTRRTLWHRIDGSEVSGP